jgi:hypothetical protein
MNKKQMIIAGIVLGAIALWYFLTLKKRKNIDLTAPKESGFAGKVRKQPTSSDLHLSCPSGYSLGTVPGTNNFKCYAEGKPSVEPNVS